MTSSPGTASTADKDDGDGAVHHHDAVGPEHPPDKTDTCKLPESRKAISGKSMQNGMPRTARLTLGARPPGPALPALSVPSATSSVSGSGLDGLISNAASSTNFRERTIDVERFSQ